MDLWVLDADAERNARGGSLASILFFLLMALCQGAAAFGAFAETTQVVPAPVRATLAPRRVLMLYSDNRLLPANILFEGSFREALRSHHGEPIDCCSEFLDEVRFPARHLERMRDLVQVKYGESPPDVIVAFAPPASGFCLWFLPLVSASGFCLWFLPLVSASGFCLRYRSQPCGGRHFDSPRPTRRSTS